MEKQVKGKVLFNGANAEPKDFQAEIEVKAELPAATVGDAGKAVMVNAEGEYGLNNVPSPVPVPTVADAGKAVMVGSDGNYGLNNVPTPEAGTKWYKHILDFGNSILLHVMSTDSNKWNLVQNMMNSTHHNHVILCAGSYWDTQLNKMIVVTTMFYGNTTNKLCFGGYDSFSTPVAPIVVATSYDANTILNDIVVAL